MDHQDDHKTKITLYLKAWQKGNADAGDKLIQAVYIELKKISHAYLKKEYRNSAFQTTDLVNEAFIRLVDQKNINWHDRVHFYGVAAKLMRQILIESIRRKQAQKRGGGEITLALNEEIDFSNKPSLDLVRLDDALHALASIDPRKSQLVELRFFAGLRVDECAEVMKISEATVKREWVLAKAWLHRRMTRRVG